MHGETFSDTIARVMIDTLADKVADETFETLPYTQEKLKAQGLPSKLGNTLSEIEAEFETVGDTLTEVKAEAMMGTLAAWLTDVHVE